MSDLYRESFVGASDESMWDAVIIGAGHNGLTAGAYLARAGRKVCVLERRHVLGGAATTEALWPGYRVSTAAYVISLFLPRIIEELRLKDYGLRILPRNPSSFTPTDDGRSLLMGPDAALNLREISKFSRRDAEAYPQYEALLDRVSRALDRALLESAPDPLPLPRSWRRIGWRKRLADGGKLYGTTYKAVVNLPKIPGGYSLVYQRCCRNQLIKNIIGPLRTGMTAIAFISEEALDGCNNSAVFNLWPPVAICIHQPIDFDHSATDPDGDSLVYRLCTPLHGADSVAPIPQPPNPGPYEEVIWKDPPYNLSNVLGGQPLTIDPTTGFLTGVPNLVGNFVVGVCVDEYRDGEFISTTRRDFQYNVSDCGQPVAAFFVPEVFCDTLKVKFNNQGLNTHSYTWYFDWGGDTSLTSTAYSPTFTFPDTGYYTVALFAESKPTCRDSFFKTIHLTHSHLDLAFDYSYPDCDDSGLIVQATNLSMDTLFGVTHWQWTLSGPGGFIEQSSDQNPTFTVSIPGKYNLKLVATSGNGCTETLNLPFSPPVPPVISLADSTTICMGDTVALFPDADATYTYQWSPATGLSDTSAPNPLAFPSNTTTYNVTISGNGPCITEKSTKVVVTNPGILTATATTDTIFPGGTSQLQATMPGATIFQWQPSSSLSNPNISNPVASPETTTTYIVTSGISGTCEQRDTVTVVVRSVICEEPYVFFPTGFSPNGDGENDELKLESNIVTEVYWVIYNRWGEKVFEANALDDARDGTFREQPQPVETYGYYLRAFCIGGEVFEKKGNVTLLR